MENWRAIFLSGCSNVLFALSKLMQPVGIRIFACAHDKSRLIPITKYFIGPVFRFVQSTILLPDPLSPAGNIEWFKRHR